jgi:hypothetical protein
LKKIQFSPPLQEYLPALKIKADLSPQTIWDPIRKKWIIMTREEWIRQLFVMLLSKHWPLSRIAVEKRIYVYQKQKRFDLVLYDKDLQPYMLFEFKNPEVKITNFTFEQAAQYNYTLRVPYLCISNGPDTYCCHIDWELKEYIFLDTLPL